MRVEEWLVLTVTSIYRGENQL